MVDPDASTTRRIDLAVALWSLVVLILLARAGSASTRYAASPVAIIAALAAVSGRYRARLIAGVRSRWRAVAAFAADRAHLPIASAALFVSIPAALIYLSNGRTEGAIDTWPVVPTAISVLADGDSRLDEFCGSGPWRRRIDREGHLPLFLRQTARGIYSGYPAGMVPLALPLVGLSRLAGGRLDEPATRQRVEKLAAASVAAASMGVFFLLALHLAPPGVALFASWTLAIGSGMFSTAGQGLWQHGGIILWELVALLCEVRSSRRGMVLQGFACGMLPACRLSAATFLVPFGLWMLSRSPRRATVVVGIALLTYLPWAWFYMTIYGAPFGPSSGLLSGSFWSGDLAGPLAGVLASPSRGLLVYQPWVVLAAIPWDKTAVGPRGWRPFLVSAIAGHLLLVAAWPCWWGGWCWGSRLSLDVVPLLTLLCLGPIGRLCGSRAGRAVVGSLAIAGVLMQVPCVYLGANRWSEAADVDRRPEALWSWADAPFLLPFRGGRR